MGMRGILVVVCILIGATSAQADVPWHAGLNIRGDLGTHPIRAGGGVQFGRVDTMLVVDPMFWTDGQHDLEAFAFWSPCSKGWGLIGGWRTSTIGLVDGTQFQEKLVLGIGAPLPRLGEHIRTRFAFELATLVVKHGGDLPTEWVSFASGRDFIDLVNFGMFITVEYASH